MSKRKRMMRALRDSLARELGARVGLALPGIYDLGLRILSTALGVRVSARIGPIVVTRTLWPRTIKKGLDVLATALVDAYRRQG